jgi:hypothetical protein
LQITFDCPCHANYDADGDDKQSDDQTEYEEPTARRKPCGPHEGKTQGRAQQNCQGKTDNDPPASKQLIQPSVDQAGSAKPKKASGVMLGLEEHEHIALAAALRFRAKEFRKLP